MYAGTRPPNRSRVRPTAVAPALSGLLGSLLLVFVSACAATGPPRFIDGGAPSEDGLRRVWSNDFAEVWLLPDVDWSQFTFAFVADPPLRYREGVQENTRRRTRYVRGTHRLPESMEKDLPRRLQAAFVDVLRYRTRHGASSRVLVQAALADVFVPVPVERVTPDVVATSQSAGAMTLVVEVRSPEEGAVIARIIDRQAIESASTGMVARGVGPAQYESRRIIDEWAAGFARLLDRLGVGRA